MVTGDALAPGAGARGEAKEYLRIFGSDEDALIDRLLGAAAEQCERFIGQALVVRGFAETVAAETGWRRLAQAPVRAIAGVEALGTDGAAAALPAGGYAIDIDADGTAWLRIARPEPAGRVRIGYSAGLAAAWHDLPAALRQGIVRLAADLYAHRDEAGGGGLPAAVASLWRPWRTPALGSARRVVGTVG